MQIIQKYLLLVSIFNVGTTLHVNDYNIKTDEENRTSPDFNRPLRDRELIMSE